MVITAAIIINVHIPTCNRVDNDNSLNTSFKAIFANTMKRRRRIGLEEKQSCANMRAQLVCQQLIARFVVYK